MKTAAILVAAGSSARMKSGGASKTMMEIGGEPVLSRTLRAFENAACISKIVIVARACDFDAIQKASAFVTKPLTITEGGKERQDSVQRFAVMQSISPCTMRRDRLSRRRKSKPCARTRKNTARRRWLCR